MKKQQNKKIMKQKQQNCKGDCQRLLLEDFKCINEEINEDITISYLKEGYKNKKSSIQTIFIKKGSS